MRRADTRRLALLLLPYLRLKKRQAKLIVRAIDLLDETPPDFNARRVAGQLTRSKAKMIRLCRIAAGLNAREDGTRATGRTLSELLSKVDALHNYYAEAA